MKIGFLKKLCLLLTVGFGAMTLASCQSTNVNDAKFDINNCVINIVQDQSTGSKYIEYSIYVINNTIYDVTHWNVTLEGYDATGKTIKHLEIKDYALYVSHGVAGVLVNKEKVEKDEGIVKAAVKGAEVSKYLNVWETYLVWWIIAIVALGISFICYAVAIFKKGLTKAELDEMLRQRMASILVGFSFALIICLLPIFFGGWMISVIFFSTMGIAVLGAALLTAIRKATLKGIPTVDVKPTDDKKN